MYLHSQPMETMMAEHAAAEAAVVVEYQWPHNSVSASDGKLEEEE